MNKILSDFLVATSKGYYCRYGDFYIDPMEPVETALISHAHGDHARPGHQRILGTKATLTYMQHRFPRQPLQSYAAVAFGDRFAVNAVSVTFTPAGHMLGSAQILMEYQGTSYLYTGDIKIQADPSCEPLETVAADVLITETTFADPQVVHPNPIGEIHKLGATEHNIMLGCYALGKAQRLTYLINQHCPEKTIYVHHNILPLHRIYDRIGLVPLRYEIYHRKALNEGKNKIYLVPPMTFNNYIRAKNVLRAFASGWRKLQRHNDIELYISDHVDWPQLLTLIEAVNPREIWTVHGDGSLLTEYLKAKIPVRPLANG